MNKLLTAITLSMTALVATSAMAGSQDDRRYYHGQYEQNHWDHKNDQRWNNQGRYDNNNRNDRYNYRVNPSREWRSGQYLPSQFNTSHYRINYKNYRQLPKPNKNESWYKVNGDYVLVNERSNRIIRIVG